MDFPTYIPLAKRTESIKAEGVTVSQDAFLGVVQMIISANNLLDQFKKHIFYGRAIDSAVWKTNTQLINEALGAAALPFNLDHPGTPTISFNPDTLRVVHGIIGASTESGELLEALVAGLISDKPFDAVNISEEMCDTMWYFAILCDSLNIDLPAGLGRNIEKLRARYPEKFTEHDAQNRDLSVERGILEKNW